MTESTQSTRAARRARHARIRAAIDVEEAEAAEAEAAENAEALDVPLHLRITRSLDAELRQRAAHDQIPTSALVRRLLTTAIRDSRVAGLTEDDVERIARRVVGEHTSR